MPFVNNSPVIVGAPLVPRDAATTATSGTGASATSDRLFLVASYEGVEFPVAESSFSSPNDSAQHKAYGVPGALVEPLGAGVNTGTMTIPLYNGIKWHRRLFPDVYNDLYRVKNERPIGGMIHPTLGALRVHIDSLQEVTEASRTDGVVLTMQFTVAEEFLDLIGPSVSSALTASAADTDRAAFQATQYGLNLDGQNAPEGATSTVNVGKYGGAVSPDCDELNKNIRSRYAFFNVVDEVNSTIRRIDNTIAANMISLNVFIGSILNGDIAYQSASFLTTLPLVSSLYTGYANTLGLAYRTAGMANDKRAQASAASVGTALREPNRPIDFASLSHRPMLGFRPDPKDGATRTDRLTSYATAMTPAEISTLEFGSPHYAPSIIAANGPPTNASGTYPAGTRLRIIRDAV